ncbi:MAG: phosphatase PAP2 family protein, partial [Gemmatimonadales bacterium]|nr:phosphatase PAP2 family protein [Gemmatimonadales bacterium]
ALAALTALTIMVRRDATRRNDRRVRKWMRRHRSGVGTGVANVVTLAGIPPVHLPVALALAWVVNRKRGVAPAVPLALASLTAFGAHHLIKAMLPSRRRPSAGWLRRHQPAFPSGHTTGATAVSLTAGYMFVRERLAEDEYVLPVAMGVPLAVGFTRLYLDRHWAADVLAGWLLGTGIAGLCITLYEETRHISEAKSRLPTASSPPGSSGSPADSQRPPP